MVVVSEGQVTMAGDLRRVEVGCDHVDLLDDGRCCCAVVPHHLRRRIASELLLHRRGDGGGGGFGGRAGSGSWTALKQWRGLRPRSADK